MTSSLKNLEARVAALEERLAEPTTTVAPQDDFWALEALERHHPDTVMVVGSVGLPDSGSARWQYGLSRDALADRDWSSATSALDALANPVRLSLLQLIFSGTRSTADLAHQDGLGTTGQLHHHLRALIAGGWLHSTSRGHYEIPPERIVPLLAILTSTTI
ncbi:MAG: helix-turn-helix domain-containing protein [Propionibacteriales bacterium]|nr:helix-turn-helix domain-containing protein [Propionibacteriales bacterium]